MVLESTVICLDNGEFMRNGDFVPTRLQAQLDAANLVLQCKLRAHPESCVALLTMAPYVDLLVGLTQDNGKLMTKLYQVSTKGFSNFANGIRIAQLALKHRQNRNHKTRVILFVGSPIEEREEDLVQLAKRLKKEKIQADIVCFGETEATGNKLKAFIDTLNGKDAGSHLVIVSGGTSLQDALVQSSVLRGEDGAAPSVAINTGGGFDFGIDPNDDPELAMALRVSLEEQRQRQEQEVRAQTGSSGQPVTGGAGSLEGLGAPPLIAPVPSSSTTMGEAPNFEAMTEDEQLAYALQLSAGGGEDNKPPSEPMEVDDNKKKPSPKTSPAVAKKEDKTAEEVDNIMSDPAALEQLVSNLPGVDPKSDVVRNAMANAAQSSSSKKKEEKKTSDKKEEEDKK